MENTLISVIARNNLTYTTRWWRLHSCCRWLDIVLNYGRMTMLSVPGSSNVRLVTYGAIVRMLARKHSRSRLGMAI